MSMPMDYSMCCQTVTVYRKTESGISRVEIPGCFLQWQEEKEYDRLGAVEKRKFLLIQPGERQLVFPGDRVLAGIGPEVSPEDWATFLPTRIPGLVETAYATAYSWQGRFCHTEAGRK